MFDSEHEHKVSVKTDLYSTAGEYEITFASEISSPGGIDKDSFTLKFTIINWCLDVHFVNFDTQRVLQDYFIVDKSHKIEDESKTG